MSGLEVSSVVTSILSAFNNGMDVFRRMRVRNRSKKRNKDVGLTQEDVQLQDSLRCRPEEIKAEYNRSVAKLGRSFEKGDAIAHTSLSHTLLVLNTGLMNIINNALSNDTKQRHASHRSLYSLSETAATDALQALGQLNMRLTASSQLSLVLTPQLRTNEHMARRLERKEITSKQPVAKVVVHSTMKKRPDPSPLMARGGWVRSKSGSSLITAASASKLSVMRPVTHQRSKSSPVGTKKVMKDAGTTSAPESPKRVQTPFKALQSDEAPGMVGHQRQLSATGRRLHREPSMLLVSADFFTSTDHLPRPQSPYANQQHRALHQTPNALQPQIPLRSRHSNIDSSPTMSSTLTTLPELPSNSITNNDMPYHSIRPDPRPRPRPVSIATFKTASTKIGEIPEHRWIDNHHHPHTIDEFSPFSPLRPLPYTIPPPLNPGPGDGSATKRKKKGWRFWRKSSTVDREGGGVVVGQRDVLVF